MATKFNVGSRVVTPSGATGAVLEILDTIQWVRLDGPWEYACAYFEHELKEEPIRDDPRMRKRSGRKWLPK